MGFETENIEFQSLDVSVYQYKQETKTVSFNVKKGKAMLFMTVLPRFGDDYYFSKYTPVTYNDTAQENWILYHTFADNTEQYNYAARYFRTNVINLDKDQVLQFQVSSRGGGPIIENVYHIFVINWV